MRWVAFWLNCGSMFLNHLYILFFTYIDVVIVFIHTYQIIVGQPVAYRDLGHYFHALFFRIAWSKAVVPCPLSFFRGIPVCSVDVFLGEKNSHISGPMMQEVRNVWIFFCYFWEFEGCWHDFKQGSVVDELLAVSSTCFYKCSTSSIYSHLCLLGAIQVSSYRRPTLAASNPEIHLKSWNSNFHNQSKLWGW